MEKRYVSYFVVGLLLISSFAAIGLGKEASILQIVKKNANIQKINLDLDFSAPTVSPITIGEDTYSELDVSGANNKLFVPGAPVMSFYTNTYELPFGSKIISVACKTSQVQLEAIQYYILPAPQPVPVLADTENSVAEYVMDEIIYNSVNLFPDNWFAYNAGGGLNSNGEHKTFLTVRAYPVKYSPAAGTIRYVENLELTVTYQIPLQNPIPTNDAFDLVIIAPSAWHSELQKLATHKNSMGVPTTIKDVEEIYTEYDGVDAPEDIKLYIKDAIETLGIKYVLLVGGLKSHITGVPRDDANQGTDDWKIPVRYSNLWDGTTGIFDPGYACDLYYADIYNSTGDFDDWDSNNDGIFAKWIGMTGKDKLDLYPDVYVGRLPIRNKNEVKIMVNKIINYEKEPAGSWYDNMILIGGDSHDDSDADNFYEGEVVTDYIWETHMSSFNPVRLYASYKNTDPTHTPIKKNIIREMNAGAGHLLFDGHGNPASWSTHWPFDQGGGWADGIESYWFVLFRNGGKLPVTVVGGCHNSQFNVSILWTLLEKPMMWTYGTPIPDSFSEWIVRKINGGSIAAFGNTGLGYGWVGGVNDLNGDGIEQPVCLEGLGGYLQVLFYNALNESTTKILGEAWAGGISDYVDVFSPFMSNPPGDGDPQIDCKTVQEWPMIGDPSLKVGGYPAAAGLKAKIGDMTSGVEADVGESVEFNGIAYDGQGPYTYAWDLDEDGIYDDATGATAFKSWIIPGVYWVSLKVTDGNGKVATYDTIVGVGDWIGLGNWLNNFEENQNSDPLPGQSQSSQNQQIIGMQSLILKSKAVNNN